MKKLVFGFVAVVALGLNVNAKEIITTDRMSEKKHFVTAKAEDQDLLKIGLVFEFGRKSKGCEGFGVCKLTIEFDIPLDQVFFKGGANSNGNLHVEVTKLGLETLNRKFGYNGIVIEEDFQISDDTCKQLGLKDGYVIKAGKYDVKVDKSGINYIIL